MQRGKRTLVLYWTVAGLFALVIGWWMVFFNRQGALLVDRLEDAGFQLTPEQTAAIHDAADRSLRMFTFEGGFLVLLALTGLLLVVRSMRREVLLYRQQRDFLSAVTHELRSPIAAARLHVESLRLGRVPEAKREAYLDRTLTDLDRLSRTVDQLLVAARASSGRVQIKLEPFDLAEFVRRAVKRESERRAFGARIDIVANVPVRVNADGETLDTILSNLLSNAAKYGGDDPHVEVRVDEVDGRARLEVRDFGPGLAEGDSDNLFDPFVRGGGEVVKKRPGIGLGLYLVAQLTKALGGEIRARNVSDGTGFLVQISLPLASMEERTSALVPSEA